MSRIVGFLVLAFTMFALAGEAQACVCVSEPLEDRLDEADAAIVGRVVSEAFPDPTGSGPSRVLGVEVEQRVKGKVPDESTGDDKRKIFVRTPYRTDCDASIARNESVGLLLARAPDGAWLANACSVVAAGALVAVGGEPRGGVIKVVIGLALLGIVLTWALRRRRLGIRPDLPGPPEP